ncbi:hypothetical protein AB0H71_31660 [Nocardia sp. NPDC050697]|uniref:hypothetical protein n=1 Tax=Nocardia sp. NPDC050697 TaxID=3155158 RepID=UPI0033F1B18D
MELLLLLLAGVTGKVLLTWTIWGRLRARKIEQTGHRRHVVDLVRVLPHGSELEARHEAGGLHTKVTVGPVTKPKTATSKTGGRRGR